jgi:hypothetical protein
MFVESLAPFFDEFAVSCTVNGASRRGIFDTPYRLGGIASAGMSALGPTLTLPTADVSADPVGQAVVIGSTNYVVAAHEPDGTGVSVLMLERA